MTPTDTDSPEDVPEDLTTALDACSDSQLREVIDYAQRRLGDRPPLTDALEPRDGERLLRTVDHEGYTIAVVERPGSVAAGPFAYRVKWEPDVDGGDGQYRWHYLGRVHAGGGGASDD